MSLTPAVESVGYMVIVTACVCPAITLPVFVLRLYGALRVLKRWHWDDTLIVFAAFFVVINSIVNSLQTRNGLGLHIVDVPSLNDFQLYSIAGSTTSYNLATMCVKASVLLYYLRFPSSRAFRYATYSVLVVSVGYTFTGFLAFAYSCTPIEYYWDKSIDGKCIDSSAALLARAILNVATDACILLLPIWLLWPLRLSCGRKLGVTVVLMAGGFVFIASVLRLVAFFTDKPLQAADLTWHYVKNTNWCLIEVWSGVFCACLPGLKCVYSYHFPGASRNKNRGNRRMGSLLSMIRIPVTVDSDSSHPSGGSGSSFWHLSALVRKKQSCGSLEPDLEIGHEDSEDFKGPQIENAEAAGAKSKGGGEIELVHSPKSARLKTPD
ncbi:hypothetical protein OQA88_8747 [Cercophora sp. LCS_1]